MRRVTSLGVALAGLALLLPVFAALVPDIYILRFPLAFVVATMLPPIAIAAIYFATIKRHDRLDREHGLTNEF